MASTSARGGVGAAVRIKNTTETLASDNQPLIGVISTDFFVSNFSNFL